MRFALALMFCLVSAACQEPETPSSNVQSVSLDDRITSGLQLEILRNPDLGIAPPGKEPRILGTKAKNLIRYFEGWSATPYDDPAKKCTIGHGHLISEKPCAQTDLSKWKDPISAERGEQIFDDDSRIARRLVEGALTKPGAHSDDEFGALVSFVFNLGGERLRNSTLRLLVNSMETEFDKKAAASEFRKWVKATNPKTGKKEALRGLEKRRACEALLFLSQLPVKDDGKTADYEACESMGAAPEGSELIDVVEGEGL